MDHLKEGIGLRGYGQRDPLTEYKKEAFDMFQEMIGSLKETAVEQLFKVRMTQEDAPTTQVSPRAMPEWQESRGGDLDTAPGRPATAKAEPRTADGQKVGRNDPCHCGSGKKYKKCCLAKGG
jgi:preprotein translocase subunit SecA